MHLAFLMHFVHTWLSMGVQLVQTYMMSSAYGAVLNFVFRISSRPVITNWKTLFAQVPLFPQLGVALESLPTLILPLFVLVRPTTGQWAHHCRVSLLNSSPFSWNFSHITQGYGLHMFVLFSNCQNSIASILHTHWLMLNGSHLLVLRPTLRLASTLLRIHLSRIILMPKSLMLTALFVTVTWYQNLVGSKIRHGLLRT